MTDSPRPAPRDVERAAVIRVAADLGARHQAFDGPNHIAAIDNLTLIVARPAADAQLAW